MKNIFAKITLLLLIIVFSSFYIGCGDQTTSTVQTTGKFNCRLETGTRYNEETEKDETYKYYVITGYQVSSSDSLDMQEGDFSNIKEEHRNITIPKTGRDLGKDNDYPVEEIESGAFANQIILKNVVVGKNIREIGSGAFSGCTNLEYLELPFIGKTYDAVGSDRVFAHIFGASATGEGNTEIVAKISSYKDDNGNDLMQEEDTTFYLPTSLKHVKINGVVTIDGEDKFLNNIPQNAFYGITTLEKVELPATAKEINTHAFYSCTNLKSINLSNVEKVYGYAFFGCSTLKTIEFGETPSLKAIDNYAFASCSAIGQNVIGVKEVLVLPTTVESLGKGVFAGCSELKEVDLSKTKVKVLKSKLFDGCALLEKVVIKSDTTAEIFAMSNCPLLKDEKTDKYNVFDENGNTMFESSPNVFGEN